MNEAVIVIERPTRNLRRVISWWLCKKKLSLKGSKIPCFSQDFESYGLNVLKYLLCHFIIATNSINIALYSLWTFCNFSISVFDKSSCFYSSFNTCILLNSFSFIHILWCLGWFFLHISKTIRMKWPSRMNPGIISKNICTNNYLIFMCLCVSVSVCMFAIETQIIVDIERPNTQRP